MGDIARNVSGTSLFGIPMAQVWVDLLLWERFFNTCVRPSHVVELGTGSGSMSMYLHLQCLSRGIEFHSFDIALPGLIVVRGIAEQFGLLPNLLQGDVFSREVVEKVRGMIDNSSGPFVLYCDNGKKRGEWMKYGPLLRKGDYFVVHDWGTEFRREDIALCPVVVEELMVEDVDGSGSMTRWFRIS